MKSLAKLITLSSLLAGLGGFLGLPTTAYAEFDFTVRPDRGGRDIRFMPVKPGEQARNEEATVVVSNDEGRRYRIVQQQMTPFTNERGQTLSRDAIKVFSPSSTGGRLGIVFPTALEPGQTVIYDSDSSGTAENFALVFAVQPQPVDPAGTYRSELIYQMEAIDGGVPPVNVVLQVTADVRPDFFLDVKSINGGSSLNLGAVTRQRSAVNAALSVTVGAGLGGRYRIYQRLADRFATPDGNSLSGESPIQALASGADTGQTVAQEQPLSANRTLIYESDELGSAASFVVEYRADDLSSQVAGRYKSTIEFIVESDSSADFAAPVTVPIEFEIESLFYLDVEHQSAGGLNFGKFKSEEASQSRQVRIRTHNNTGQRYQVIQRVPRLFTNAAGKSLPPDRFTAVTSGAQTGKMMLMSPKPVEQGDTVVFTSDATGTPEEFFLDYSLTIPRDAAGGEYTSETTYTLSTLS